MAITTDTGAKKIAGSDNWRDIFDDHNETVDAYDRALSGLADGLAIIATGNTHSAIASGQYVYVRGHSSLAEGLYKATASIATNGTLSTSNLTADGSGGLNDLQGQVTTLNSKFTSQIVTISPDSNGTFVMDIDYSTFVSMSCSDASNYLCFVRKSASDKCVVFSYDDIMNKMTSGSYNARVWTRVP